MTTWQAKGVELSLQFPQSQGMLTHPTKYISTTAVFRWGKWPGVPSAAASERQDQPIYSNDQSACFPPAAMVRGKRMQLLSSCSATRHMSSGASSLTLMSLGLSHPHPDQQNQLCFPGEVQSLLPVLQLVRGWVSSPPCHTWQRARWQGHVSLGYSSTH